MATQARKLYIPILVQITLPYLLLAMAVSAGATYITSRLIVDSVEERFTNQLIATAVQAQESLVRKEEALLVDLRLLSNIQGVAAAVQSRDLEQLVTLLVPVALNDGVEYFAVLARSGTVLVSAQLGADGYVQATPPAGLREQPLVAEVLAGRADAIGDKYAAVLPFPAGHTLVLSGPILAEDGAVAGALLVGRSVSSLAADLRQESLAQVSFYDAGGQVLASTLAEPRPLSPAQAAGALAGRESGSQILPLADGALSYSELLAAWQLRGGEEAGLLGVSLAANFLVQASQFTRNNTLLLTSATALLVMLVGLLVARRITQPISRLKAAAQSAAQGDLGASVPAGGRDEIGVLAQSFNHMLANLNESKQELLGAYDSTIEGWAKATDLRDHETVGHSRRVSELSVQLAQAMGLHGQALVDLRRGALLHDIGKIALPDSILLKPGPLTAAELTQMRLHPLHARGFIEEIPFLKSSLDIPYSHHEKWDGSGYPQGLQGEQIPLAARIFAIVDVWDALTSDRPYRAALSAGEALAYVREQSGKHFDPQVVEAFLELIER